MVEWLSPVVAAISVRDGWPARRTAESTMARLRRRRSTWRIPTDIFSSSRSARPLDNAWAVGDAPRIVAEAGRTCHYLLHDSKKSHGTSKTIRIAVDSASALDQCFFEARKKASVCGFRAV